MWTFYEKNKQAIHDIVLLLAAVLGCCLFFRYLFGFSCHSSSGGC